MKWTNDLRIDYNLLGTNANLQLKREPTPPESRVNRSQSNVGTLIRRSRHLDTRNSE